MGCATFHFKVIKQYEEIKMVKNRRLLLKIHLLIQKITRTKNARTSFSRKNRPDIVIIAQNSHYNIGPWCLLYVRA
jgi:hypothetical protein